MPIVVSREFVECFPREAWVWQQSLARSPEHATFATQITLYAHMIHIGEFAAADVNRLEFILTVIMQCMQWVDKIILRKHVNCWNWRMSHSPLLERVWLPVKSAKQFRDYFQLKNIWTLWGDISIHNTHGRYLMPWVMQVFPKISFSEPPRFDVRRPVPADVVQAMRGERVVIGKIPTYRFEECVVLKYLFIEKSVHRSADAMVIARTLAWEGIPLAPVTKSWWREWWDYLFPRAQGLVHRLPLDLWREILLWIDDKFLVKT